MKSFFKKIFKPSGNSISIKESFPLKISDKKGHPIKFIDQLNDSDLIEVNKLLDWNCYIIDSKGRRFGNIAWSGKRTEAQVIPDYRHKILNDRINLSSKHVLEIGCFEGIHTISLCELSAKVTAIDSRMENIFKTIIRSAMFDHHPTVFKSDVENWQNQFDFLRADVCHHIGVLYHLKDPVRHLLDLGQIIKEGVLLDTHYANEDEATQSYEVEGQKYQFKPYGEGKDVFSGMYDHAKWLTLETLKKVLASTGFPHIEVIETREERNGPRVLLLAKKEK
jgi:2-polyprenyl-3-methyl-5-hydroxy-6-metoxy-1,4-benzoquinol methylase